MILLEIIAIGFAQHYLGWGEWLWWVWVVGVACRLLDWITN